MTLVVRAHAKVNLHLEVLRRREDGYHDIETIFQSIGLHDRLEFVDQDERIDVVCDHPQVPGGRQNLAFRAAMELRHAMGEKRGARITIDKRIPVAAGLGGGSADAAAVLRGLPRLWMREVDEGLLLDIARELGADVPFCLTGGTALGRGIGDQLTPIPSSGNGIFLVVTPALQLSTAEVYGRLRMGLTPVTPKVSLAQYRPLLARFPERGWPGTNRLGEVVLPAHPELDRLLQRMRQTHPELAMLSGSGPSLFAVYRDEDAAKAALEFVAPGPRAFHWIGRSVRTGVDIP